MIRPIPLKALRPGNTKVVNPQLPMNVPREYPDPSNTLQYRHSLPVNVARIFTTVDGTIITKTNPVVIAAKMDVSYPVFLLSQFDREGGYSIGQKVVPPLGGAKYLMTFVNGYGLTTNQICTPYSPFNTIQSQLKIGDIVQVYTDNLQSPNCFCFIVLTSTTQPMSSILANMSTRQVDNRIMKLYCENVLFKADFALQLSEPWHYVNIDNLGTYKDNQITYNMFYDPFNVLPDVLKITTEFTMNQYLGVYLYMVLGVDIMSFNFNLKMIQ